MLINGTYKNLIKTVKAATFGSIAKNKVTEVGDPWYTSGAHMWKGTAEILNAKPTKIKTMPKVKPYSDLSELLNISIKFVVTEKPYIKEHPYNNKPEDRALSIKYFKPDSVDSKLSRLNEARTYKASDWSSRPI